MAGQFDSGRIQQKQRTRRELLRAARELLEQGRHPTVAEVADHAAISRATAYRYFSTPEALIQEAILDAVSGALDHLGALEPAADPALVAERVEALVVEVLAMMLRHEALFRAYLAQAVLQDRDPEHRRGGRRLAWLGRALAPLGLPEPALTRLVQALSLVTGIEAVVVLRDICGLDAEGIEATARWMARALVGAARIA